MSAKYSDASPLRHKPHLVTFDLDNNQDYSERERAEINRESSGSCSSTNREICSTEPQQPQQQQQDKETMSFKSRRLIAKLSNNSDTSTASTSSQSTPSPRSNNSINYTINGGSPTSPKQKSTFSSMSFQRNSMSRSSRYRPVTNVPYWFINLSGPSRPTNKINGKFQSPINLASDDAIYDPTLAESPLRHHYQLTADFELINTGYVLQLSLRPRQS